MARLLATLRTEAAAFFAESDAVKQSCHEHALTYPTGYAPKASSSKEWGVQNQSRDRRHPAFISAVLGENSKVRSVLATPGTPVRARSAGGQHRLEARVCGRSIGVRST